MARKLLQTGTGEQSLPSQGGCGAKQPLREATLWAIYRTENARAHALAFSIIGGKSGIFE
jgi:hypothetical protein